MSTLSIDQPLQRLAQWLDSGTAKRDGLLLLLVACILIMTGIGLRDPWPADEPRFALIAKEMVATGNWLIPYRGGEIYAHKPPLLMWLIAALLSLTGSLKFSFLLPSALAGIGTLMLSWDLARRLWGRRPALLMGMLMLSTLQFMLQAKTAQLDALLLLFITAGIYGVVRHLVIGPCWRWYMVAWIAMGLGVLTKLIGFFPVFMLLPFLLLKWHHPERVQLHRPLLALAAPLLTVAVVAAWLVPMMLYVNGSPSIELQQYDDTLLLGQTSARYLTPEHHFKPFYYYLVNVIPLFWLPFSLLLCWLVPRWWKALRRGDAALTLLVGYGLLVLLFFSGSGGKRGVYIFTALPALITASTPFLAELLTRRWLNRLLWGLVLLLALLFSVAGLFHESILKLMARPGEVADIAPWGLLSTLGLTSLALALWLRPRRGYILWCSFSALLWLLYSSWGYLLMDPVRSPSQTMQEVGEIIGEEGELAMVAMREQYLLTADRPIVHFGYYLGKHEQAQLAAKWLQQGEHRWVLIPRRFADQCYDTRNAIDLGQRHGRYWYLMRAQDVIPCPIIDLDQQYLSPTIRDHAP